MRRNPKENFKVAPLGKANRPPKRRTKLILTRPPSKKTLLVRVDEKTQIYVNPKKDIQEQIKAFKDRFKDTGRILEPFIENAKKDRKFLKTLKQ